MNRLIFNFLLIIISTLTYAQNCKNVDLIEKTDTFYTISKNKYTGKYVEYFPGHIKTSGSFENGLKNGQFMFYDETGTLLKAEEWKNGVKNGRFKEYDYSGQIQAIEFFKNGIKDSFNLYFHYSGILEKVLNFKNGNLIDSTVYKIDDKIEKTIAMVPSESYSSVDKIKMNKLDSLSLIVVGIRNVGFEDENIIYDTIPLPTLKIISYDLSATLYVEKEGAGHIDWGYTIKQNKINERILKDLFGHFAREFWIENIIVENNDGHRWELPTRRITIKNYSQDIIK